MKLEPAILEDAFVRLEPMEEAHREGLRGACNADQRIWTELYPLSWANEHFDPTWEKLMADQAAGTTQAVTASPQAASGTPATATSATAGWSRSASSTSRG